MRRGSRAIIPEAVVVVEEYPSVNVALGSVSEVVESHYYRNRINNIMPTNGTMTELPKFGYSEISLGRVIGQGGFSVVSEIVSMDLDEVYDTSDRESKLRKDFSLTVRQRSQKGEYPYVLKMLRTDLPVEEHIKGVVDLAIEAEFLRVLQHPNIVRMRATANTDPRENRFFVILDRLGLTLDTKFNYWRKLVGENSGYWFPCCGYCCAKTHGLHAVWKDRLTTARDIARAVQHLHSLRIVYRDLKPDNLGFDSATGSTVQLFDFGLAKRLQNVERHSNGLYLLTGNTGSLRYMAPEVASDQPYNESVDAYSFGILFWQICALQTPFSGYNQRMHAEKVVQQGHRPKPDRTWPDSWTQLMQTAWSKDWTERPSFDQIVQQLEEQVHQLEQEEGVVPSRASEIRAKKKKKKPQPQDASLDVDTRLSSGVNNNNRHEKRPGAEIV